MPLKLGGVYFDVNFLLASDIKDECILGVDFLAKHNAVINFETNFLKLTNEEKEISTILFKTKNVPTNQYHICTKNENDPDKEIQHQICAINSENPTKNKSDCELDSQCKVEMKIKNICENLSKTLETNQTRTFQEILLKNKIIFRDKPGCINNYIHHLEVTDHTPYKQFQYRLNPKLIEQAKYEIEKMISEDIIEISNSPYINPIILVEKKNMDPTTGKEIESKVRICLDGRFLNKRLVPLYDAPPCIDTLLFQCSNAKYLATLDLKSSFWQVKLDKSSRIFTGFQFLKETFHYKRIPFGLSVSLGALIKALKTVIPNYLYKNVKVYVDDIFVHGETMEEFMEVLSNLFSVLREHGLTVNLEKCKFFRKSVQFLGYILTDKGIQKDPTKVQEIKNVKRPKNLKELQSFLGLINFYSKFCHTYADSTKSLYKLTSLKSTFKWTDEQQSAFDDIKQKMMEDITLHYPNLNETFYIDSDSSNFASGGVLYQMNKDGNRNIISFCSKTFKGSELNYHSTEKELLGILHCIQKFYNIIAGYRITVRTDNKAITFLHSCKNPPNRLIRWINYLGPLNINYEHIPGKSNTIADFFSRNPYEEPEQLGIDFYVSVVTESHFFQELIKNQKLDEDLQEKLRKDPKNYQITDGFICKRLGNKFLICLNKSDMSKLINLVHQKFSHSGVNKCYQIIRERFDANKLRKLIAENLKNCENCQFNKITPYSVAPYQSILPKGKLDLISIDYLGPFVTSNKYKYILVIMDNFTKFVKLYPTLKANLYGACKSLTSFISDIGTPNRCLSDNATCFTTNRWKCFLDKLKIARVLTSIRHPMGNNVERVNRDVLQYLRLLINGKHTKWCGKLYEVETTINSTYHTTTSLTPIQAMFGVSPLRFWNMYIGDDPGGRNLEPEEVEKIIKDNIEKYGNKTKSIKDKNKKFVTFKVGDQVLIRSLRIPEPNLVNAKLLPLYQGPYEVLDKVGKYTFIIGDKTNKIRGMFHTNLLKKYYN